MGWYDDEKNAEKIAAEIRAQTDAIDNLRAQQKRQYEQSTYRPSKSSFFDLFSDDTGKKVKIGIFLFMFSISLIIRFGMWLTEVLIKMGWITV